MFTYWLESKSGAGEEWAMVAGSDFQARNDDSALKQLSLAKRRKSLEVWKLRLMCDEGNGIGGQIGPDVTRPQFRVA